jgi:fructuronate reductase
VNPKRLSNATLANVAARRPRYDRALLQTGIVHLGVGAFHRAHQAVYTEDCLDAGDPRWGIVGASLRSSDTRDALMSQDMLYSVVTREGDARELRVIGALRHLLVAPESPTRLLGMLCLPSVKVVTLTVTEKGYCLEPSSGDLNEADAGIRHDLVDPEAPRTAPGFIVEAIAQRRARGLAPFTVLSCDNLSHNGRTTHRALTRFAQLRNADLGRYVADEIACPSTMVDRIVPATTDADRARVAGELGVEDRWPVVTEAFTQWVIEDNFPQGRPDWAASGAQMVSDVAPFELMKLRLLNGPHSSIAYLGQLAGLDTVADVMDTEISGFVAALMDDAQATLPQPPAGLAGYKAQLLTRFRNRALMHRTEQIAMDGSMKLPPRIVQPVRDALARRLPVKRHALVIAAWIRFLQGKNERGQALTINDPMADILTRLARAERPAGDVIGNLLGVGAVFSEVGQDVRLREAVTDAFNALVKDGARATARNYTQR